MRLKPCIITKRDNEVVLFQPLGKPESGNHDDTDIETLTQEEETDTMSKVRQ